MTKKRVVQAWTQKARNHQQTERAGFWGIGDLLRGSNVLFDTCQALGVNYSLDIQGHPVSQIFAHRDPEPDVDGAEIEFWTFDTYDEVATRIADALNPNDSLILNTNGGPIWPPGTSNDWKAFIKQIMRPNPSFEEHLAKIMPAEPYNAFHFRLGDAGLVRGERSQLNGAIEALDRHGEPDDVIITDSAELKEHIRSHRPEFRVSEAKPVHTGLSFDVDSIAQTMSDFFLIGGARKAKSYSVYPGPSGFVVSAARIFDVPLVSAGHRVTRVKKSFIRKVIDLWR